MSQAGYAIAAWATVVLIVAIAAKVSGSEVLKLIAQIQAGVFVGSLALAGFVLVAAI